MKKILFKTYNYTRCTYNALTVMCLVLIQFSKHTIDEKIEIGLPLHTTTSLSTITTHYALMEGSAEIAC